MGGLRSDGGLHLLEAAVFFAKIVFYVSTYISARMLRKQGACRLRRRYCSGMHTWGQNLNSQVRTLYKQM